IPESVRYHESSSTTENRLLQEATVYLPDHNLSSHEIRIPLIQKARVALRPFKNSWPIWMVRVIDAITQFLSALSAARDSLLSVNQDAVIDAETFGKGSQIGDKEFSSRKDAFELRLRSRLLRRAVR